MRYSFAYRPGYVYCVRRSGKTQYSLGSAPAGHFCDRLQRLAQGEDNSLVLLGWVEVRDHVMAEQNLKAAFHLYRMEDDWFDFRSSRAADLKSLLETYANLADQLSLEARLIDDEGVPDYDRSFGFFELIHQYRGRPYYPVETSTPVRNQTGNRWGDRPKWPYAVGAGAIGLLGLLGANGLTSRQSMNTISPPESRPEVSPSPSQSSTKSKRTVSSIPVSPTVSPTIKAQKAVKSTISTPNPDPSPPVDGPKGEPKTMIWSESSEGAKLRSSPSRDNGPDDSNFLDFLPNGTPVTLGELSGAWQEVILPDGRRGWVSNSLVKE